MIDELAEKIYRTAWEKMFWDHCPEYYDHLIGTKLALIDSEVAEVLEAYRKDMGSEKLLEEIADIIIRVLDLYKGLERHGSVEGSLEQAIYAKMEVNESRDKKHGNRF